MTRTHTTDKPLLFPLGRMLATPAALRVLDSAGQSPFEFIARHVRGDWGDCTPEDATENDLSVNHCSRIFSVYHTRDGRKLWVITEADRCATTVLLPSDY
jgi:hypothetical protein